MRKLLLITFLLAGCSIEYQVEYSNEYDKQADSYKLIYKCKRDLKTIAICDTKKECTDICLGFVRKLVYEKNNQDI